MSRTLLVKNSDSVGVEIC